MNNQDPNANPMLYLPFEVTFLKEFPKLSVAVQLQRLYGLSILNQDYYDFARDVQFQAGRDVSAE